MCISRIMFYYIVALLLLTQSFTSAVVLKCTISGISQKCQLSTDKDTWKLNKCEKNDKVFCYGGVDKNNIDGACSYPADTGKCFGVIGKTAQLTCKTTGTMPMRFTVLCSEIKDAKLLTTS